MKKQIFIIALLAVSAVATSFAQGVIKFQTETHDFGKIQEGDPAVFTFEFTNSGSAPVVISNAQPSCGCTTPDWSRDPIMPGKTGKVTASYGSQGRPGPFNKTITVSSNAETPSIKLTISGEVIPKTDVVNGVTLTPVQKVVPPVKKTSKKNK